MKTAQRILLLSGVAFLLVRCGDSAPVNYRTPLPEGTEDAVQDQCLTGGDVQSALTASVTYNGNIKALFEAKCVSCHKSGGTPPDLTTFDLVKATADTNLSEIKNGSMPPGKPLSDSDKKLFQDWVSGGMLKEESAPSSAPESSPAKDCTTPSQPQAELKITYGANIKAILDKDCVSCHRTGGTKPDLSTYELAKQNGQSSLADIEKDSMPISYQLKDDEKAKFKSWVAAGMPQ